MNRCVVKMLNGQPVGIIYKDNGAQNTLTGSSLIRYLGRIDESLIGRKVRRNPFIKEEGDSLIYISRLHKKNIRIKNTNETMEALYDLYMKDRQEYRKLFDREAALKQRKVKRAATVAGVIMIGGLALGKMAATALQPLDLETVATYDGEAIKEENTNELIAMTETKELEVNSAENVVQVIDDSQNIVEDELLTDEEIQSIVTAPVQVNVDANYDAGIEKNIEYLEDIINERSNRWGVSPELVHDIISQESSGGKYDQVGQFEFRWWHDKEFTLHNYETNKDVVVVFSNNSSEWAGKADIIISEEDLKNVKTQVSVIPIILQIYFDMYDHNIPITIQAYNRGQTNVDELLRKTAQGEGLTVEELKADQNNLSWIDYAWKDENNLTYFQEVAQHISENQQRDGINDTYSMSYIDEEGNIQTVSFQAQLNVKNR